MRALVQRVESAAVTVDGETVGEIGAGLCAFVGVAVGDEAGHAERLADRLWGLRVFEDAAGKTNLAAADLGAPLLVVSQFTLYADTTRGRRPSFTGAAPGDRARDLVEVCVAALRELGATVATGRFGAHMKVALVNDGPFTLLVEV